MSGLVSKSGCEVVHGLLFLVSALSFCFEKNNL